MKVLFALPGLHRYNRGAETAFMSIAKELVSFGASGGPVSVSAC
jgi:hypothetical protein